MSKWHGVCCVQQMQSEQVQSQRVGIIGTIKLVERLAHPSPTPPAHPAALGGLAFQGAFHKLNFCA